MSASLVGSEMCIRDRASMQRGRERRGAQSRSWAPARTRARIFAMRRAEAVSYTHLTLPTICSV
eukprot:7938039-Alexandrium_andersonii.AAC.1